MEIILFQKVKTTFWPFSQTFGKQGVLTIQKEIMFFPSHPLHPLPLTNSCSILQLKKYIYISNTELLKEKSINARETLVWNYHSFPELLSSLQTPKCFIFNLLLLSCFGYEVALLFSVLPWSTRRITVQPSDI